ADDAVETARGDGHGQGRCRERSSADAGTCIGWHHGTRVPRGRGAGSGRSMHEAAARSGTATATWVGCSRLGAARAPMEDSDRWIQERVRVCDQKAGSHCSCRGEGGGASARQCREVMFGLLLGDLRKKAAWCYENERPQAVLKVLLTDGTMAMVIYRAMQWARRWRLAPLELLLNRLNSICCNCIIGRGAEFGAGFVLIHATGVVITGTVRGGENGFLEH